LLPPDTTHTTGPPAAVEEVNSRRGQGTGRLGDDAVDLVELEHLGGDGSSER